MEARPAQLPPLIPFNRAGKWGFCNPDREIVIGCNYDWVDRFRALEDSSLALVATGTRPQERCYGMIQPDGEVLIPLEYSSLEPFSCGFAKMRHDGKSLYGFIDRLGRPLTHHEFETAQSFSEGWAYVSRPLRRRVQEHGFLNTRGELGLPGTLLYDDAGPFQQGFSVVTHYAARGYFYSYLGTDGTFLSVRKPDQAFKLDWLSSASPFNNGRALMSGELTGFAIIDKTGTMVADLGFEFEAAYPSSQGLIRVVKGPDTGFLDTEGNEVIPCMLDYARVQDFSCGLAAFQETAGGLWGFFDRQLNVVVPPSYAEASDFRQGLATVKRGDAYCFIDTRGQERVSPRYSYIGSFEGGLALSKRAGNTFFIDANGIEYQSH